MLPIQSPRDLFLSYSGANKALAIRISEELGHFRYSVWHYKNTKFDGTPIIPGGVEWWKDICWAVVTSQAVLVLVSEHSMKSEVVKDEVALAHSCKQKVLLILHRMNWGKFCRLCTRCGVAWHDQFGSIQPVFMSKGVGPAIPSLLDALEYMQIIPGNTDRVPRIWRMRHVEAEEKKVPEIHVTTLGFHYDLFHPHYKDVVKANLMDGKQYVYYFPESKQALADRVKAQHGLPKNTRQLLFVPMPDVCFTLVECEKVVYVPDGGGDSKLVHVDVENHMDVSSYDYLMPTAECVSWMEKLKICKAEYDAGLRRRKRK